MSARQRLPRPGGVPRRVRVSIFDSRTFPPRNVLTALPGNTCLRVSRRPCGTVGMVIWQARSPNAEGSVKAHWQGECACIWALVGGFVSLGRRVAKSPLYFMRLAQSMTGPNARTRCRHRFNDFSLAAVGGGSSHGLVDMGRTVWRFFGKAFSLHGPVLYFLFH